MQASNEIPAVEVSGLAKNFGSVEALKGVDLEVEPGQYFVLLGPSGSGKTTLLRLIGGFSRATRGRVLLHGIDVTNLPPDKRPTSMVFQSYALFPHMTVSQNVGYGLRLKSLAAAEIAERTDAMLEMVGLAKLGDRQPHELSGGQQQRVQLARSLVLERDILLLDEPLASLDANLRKDMCFELKRLQEKVGITFIHVTHNQEEAMTVADRIAIMANGELVEVGTAKQIYERPEKRFTADFIGENNLFDGTVLSVSGTGARIDLGVDVIMVECGNLELVEGTRLSISIRSELIELLSDGKQAGPGLETLSGSYLETVYLGLTTAHIVALEDGREVYVRKLSDGGNSQPKTGETVRVCWKLADARLHLS
jgi:ABC-type Fe3+/spermidine/putrescine transport system ATPase subunit